MSRLTELSRIARKVVTSEKGIDTLEPKKARDMGMGRDFGPYKTNGIPGLETDSKPSRIGNNV